MVDIADFDRIGVIVGIGAVALAIRKEKTLEEEYTGFASYASTLSA